MCPRSSVTGSCLRNGHVLSWSVCVSQILGNWELPQKWACFKLKCVSVCPRSSVTGSCLMQKWACFKLKCVCVCPRSSVTGSCLRNGHVLSWSVCVCVSQILGNWELPQKWACFKLKCVCVCPRSSVTGSCLRNEACFKVKVSRSPATGSCLRHVVYIWARSRQPVYFWGWAVIQRFRQATQSCLVSWGVKSIYFWDNMPENELM